MSPKYLISRVGDPLFALFIGAGATVARVRREEREAGRGPAETWDGLARRVGYYFGY